MSFDWNLSSDEENDFDDWAAANAQPFGSAGTASVSVPSVATAMTENTARVSDNADETSSSSSDEDDWGSSKPPAQPFTGIAFSSESNDFKMDGDSDDNEDEDEVDWEDAGEIIQKLAADANTAAAPTQQLKPVSFEIHGSEHDENRSEEKNEKQSSKRIARKRYRYEQLTTDLQYLLSNLEKAHLLSLTSHTIFVSGRCSSDESLHFAHSLIPLAWVKTQSSAPTRADLSHFCNFFFHLVHQNLHQTAETIARMPRRRRGRKGTTQSSHKDIGNGNYTVNCRTKEFCRHLGIRAEDRNMRSDFNNYDEAQLFVAMIRSLGWRARIVFALEPSKRDLDIHHPLFVAMSTRNVFQKLWKSSKKPDQSSKSLDDDKARKMPAKRRKLNSGTSGSTSKLLPLVNPSDLQPTLCWVEVLCDNGAASDQASTRKNGHKKNQASKKLRWIHLDPHRELIDQPESIETILHALREGIRYTKSKKKRPVTYVLAAEHISLPDNSLRLRLADVSPRYASSFVECLKSRGIIRGKNKQVDENERVDKWWAAVLKSANLPSHKKRESLKLRGHTQEDAIDLDEEGQDGSGGDMDQESAVMNGNGVHAVDDEDHDEKELHAAKLNEPIPTSKTAFKTNPIYTLPSLLNSNEVLKPDAKKRVCGVFKGEFVFRRSDVETALAATKWLYKGRKVKEAELQKPIKRVKRRKKPNSKSFRALKSYGVGDGNTGGETAREKIIADASKPLDDGMEDLYASWQTNAWSPAPVGPGDEIPVNEYKNVELALLNPGLVHIDERFVAKVAKRLGVAYAPCLLGFEGHGGNRTPTIRGIVVHAHNEELLREAHAEMASHFLQEEHDKKQQAILLRWKRLLVGVLTKDRLEREYGDN